MLLCKQQGRNASNIIHIIYYKDGLKMFELKIKYLNFKSVLKSVNSSSFLLSIYFLLYFIKIFLFKFI